MRLDSTYYSLHSGAIAPRSKLYPVSTSVLSHLTTDSFQVRFRGVAQPAEKPKNLWVKLTHGPAPKLIAGTVLLAAGIAIKVMGSATVLGAPILVPLGLGIAVSGSALMGWGTLQLLDRSKTHADRASLPTPPQSPPPAAEEETTSTHNHIPNHTGPLDQPVQTSENEVVHSTHSAEQPCRPPQKEFRPSPTSNLDSLYPSNNRTAEEERGGVSKHRMSFHPAKTSRNKETTEDTSSKKKSSRKEAPILPHDTKGSSVLSCILQHETSIAEDAIDEFLSTHKGSDAAVTAGEKLDLLLKHNTSPNQYCTNGKTPLANAVLQNRPWLVSRLSKTPGFKPDRECLSGSSGLKMALLRDDAKLLIPALSKADPVDKETLQWAASCGQPEVLGKLLDRSPGVLTSKEEGQMLSLAYRQKEQVTRLKSLAPSELDEQFRSHLDIVPSADGEASQKHQNALVGLMRTGRINVNQHIYGNTPLSLACHLGNSQAVTALLYAGADPAQRDEGIRCHGFNSPYYVPLAIASNRGHEEIVKALLQTGLNPNEPNNAFYAPLVAAIHGKQNHIVDVLLSAGALIDQTIALNEAARLGEVRIMQTLLRAGADVNNTNVYGEPPLYTACKNGHENVVQTLLQDRNINVNQVDERGRIPLHTATSRNYATIVSRLLNKPGIDVNHADMDGFTPLFISQIHGYTALEQALRAHGATD